MTQDNPTPLDDQPARVPWYWRVMVAGLILSLGAGAMVVLIKARKKPRRKERVQQGLLVEVVTASKVRRRIKVVSHGQVQARRVVGIVPQVSGKVTWVHASLVMGGVIKQGERLLEIDPADYRLGVERARASVAKAQQALALELSNSKVARQEWKLLGSTVRGTGKPSPLTLREPQLHAAQASLASARADLKLAQLNLGRTTIRAPFALRVRSESVERGQYVSPGREVAKVFGTDQAEVVVSLPVADRSWIRVPAGAAGKAGVGPSVTIKRSTGAVAHRRQGTLVRSVGEVDATGRMSRVVVAISDPYNLARPGSEPGAALEMGAFVEVTIEGRVLEQVHAIPAEALRLGAKVWIAGPKDTLRIRKVTVARRTATEALVTSGIKDGDRVVISNIAGALEGMKLRLKVKGAGPAKRPEAKRVRPGAPKEAVR